MSTDGGTKDQELHPAVAAAREIRIAAGLTPSITSPDILGKVLVLMRTEVDRHAAVRARVA